MTLPSSPTLEDGRQTAGRRAGAGRTKADRGARHLIQLLDPLATARGLLLAVSGGPDSTALMHLAAVWHRAGQRPPIAVASVDHGLRPEARAEADAVVATALRLGLPATRLTWLGDKPARGVPARARAARYALLADHARVIGASHLVTAHTRDDQAETVLMRLVRGSGPGGLAAMRSLVDLGGVVLARPFLEATKRELVAVCRAGGWPFVDDPSNRDPAFARARWRAIAPALAREGLSVDRLALLAQRSARADAALTLAAQEAGHKTLLDDDGGTRRYDMRALAAEPEEVRLRVIGAAVSALGRSGEPRLERLERLVDTLSVAAQRGQALCRTLAGCTVRLDGTSLVIAPERPRRRGLRSLGLQHAARFSDGAASEPAASLGKPSRASYIAEVDATARSRDADETHSVPGASARGPLLSAGPQ